LAKQIGVKTSDAFMNLARLGEAVDVIIDETGVAKAREDSSRYMQNLKNRQTIIMHELKALLLMSLSKGELVSMKHNAVG
jgi:glyceraldehyde-3-phosphate dehydrogenase/erythrose-4-phosphate dehydrogenase